MKKALYILTFLSIIFCIVSCKKEETNESDKNDKNDNISFYDSNHRVGIWVNSKREDTLDFIDNTNLIRKGKPYSYENYLYRIDGETLFIKSPESSIETKHSILTEGNNTVTLGNMYIKFGFGDNSGIFIKQN